MDDFEDNRKDIYFEEKYVKLYENENNEAVCFVCKDDSNILLFPFLRRKFLVDNILYYDFETPYGYGGPIIKKEDNTFLESALKEFYMFCENSNYVAGFLRFHPLIDNSYLYETIGQVIQDRKTIAIDTSLSEKEIWMNEINTKNRNFIRKGEKNGLSFLVDSEYKYLKEFIGLYNETMTKLQADDFYYFNETYFERIKEIDNSFLGIIKYDDKIISSAIFFYSNTYGHYHLSGSDAHYLSMLPNNYLLYNAALEFKKKGVSKFHLGGGATSSESDSLFKFKERFSKKKYQFCIGKTIFNEEIYNKLVNDWMNVNDSAKIDKYHSHLLKYKY